MDTGVEERCIRRQIPGRGESTDKSLIKGILTPGNIIDVAAQKGCPARKQVERSRNDPTTILITYSSDHNHILSTKNHLHSCPAKNQAASGGATSPSSSSATTPPANFQLEESTTANSFTQLDIESSDNDYYVKLPGELGWLCEMGSTMMDGTTVVGPVCTGHLEMEAFEEEDELLCGDLEDLPEFSLIFRGVDKPVHAVVVQDKFL